MVVSLKITELFYKEKYCRLAPAYSLYKLVINSQYPLRSDKKQSLPVSIISTVWNFLSFHFSQMIQQSILSNLGWQINRTFFSWCKSILYWTLKWQESFESISLKLNFVSSLIFDFISHPYMRRSKPKWSMSKNLNIEVNHIQVTWFSR